MSINLRRRFTPTGLVVFGAYVLVMVLGYSTRQLFPESAIGTFLDSVGGVLLAFAAACVTVTVACVVLPLWGHPCFVSDAIGDDRPSRQAGY